MTISLTPPPLTEDQTSPIWQQWYHALYRSLSSSAGVAWATIDKAGSSIASLASKAHAELTGILGGGSYHLSQTQYDRTALLTAAATAPWNLIDKTGSSLADLATRNHSQLNNIDGGTYHLSLTQYNRATAIQTKASDPTTSDIGASEWAIYKNTGTGVVKLWVNDGGTMKSVSIT